ncbi:MAG: RsmE family RNA methyltransferase [Deltaproteobacteria bacterium]
MNLILLSADEIAADMTVTIAGRRGHHVTKVLRSSPGDRLRIGLVNGPRGTGIVENISGTTVSLSLQLLSEPPTEPPFDLILALPRPIMLRRILFQASSLGIARIFLIRSRRVEKSFFDAGLLTPEQYTPILQEGMEQSGHTWLPTITVFKRFLPFIEDFMRDYGLLNSRLVADQKTGQSLASLTTLDGSERMLVAVGPEGGWVDFERHAFLKQHFYPISLGETILRVETATAVFLGQLMLIRHMASQGTKSAAISACSHCDE